MYEELEYEFEQFKSDMESGVSFGQYFDESDYEDEYSHNQIGEFQSKFIDMVREYLHENIPGKYVMTSSWCIFVMTVEESRKRNMLRINDCIVS